MNVSATHSVSMALLLISIGCMIDGGGASFDDVLRVFSPILAPVLKEFSADRKVVAHPGVAILASRPLSTRQQQPPSPSPPSRAVYVSSTADASRVAPDRGIENNHRGDNDNDNDSDSDNNSDSDNDSDNDNDSDSDSDSDNNSDNDNGNDNGHDYGSDNGHDYGSDNGHDYGNDRDNDRDNDNGKDRDNGSDANRDGKPRRVLDYVNQLFEHIVKRPLFVADGRRPDTRSRDTKLRAAASREAVLRSAVKSVIKDLALLFRYRHVSHNSIDNQAEKVTNELFRLIRLLFS